MKQSGFTLIELLVVAGIMAVLFSGGLLVVSNFTKSNNTKLAIEELYNFLVLARSYAVSSYKNNTSVSNYNYVEVKYQYTPEKAFLNLVATRVGSSDMLSTQYFSSNLGSNLSISNNPKFNTYYGTVDSIYTYKIGGTDVVKIYPSGVIEIQ